MNDPEIPQNAQAAIRDLLIAVGRRVSAVALDVLTTIPLAERTRVAAVATSDIVYGLDHEVEKAVVAELDAHAASVGGLELVAEGIGETEESDVTRWGVPEGSPPAWRVLMDPVDGTRGIMFDKRPAWFLAAAAPFSGRSDERLSDVLASVMVEIPTTRQRWIDILHGLHGAPAERLSIDLANGTERAAPLRPDPSPTLAHGFGQISRFFHPGKVVLAELEETLMARLFGADAGRLPVFDDQYISSGGQLAELLLGRDRFVAEVRARMIAWAHATGRDNLTAVHPCHPYDLAAHGIARGCGVIVTDGFGSPLDAPFDTTTPVDWIGYANDELQAMIEPALLDVLAERFGDVDR